MTPEKFMKDGVYPGTPRAEYETIEAATQSMLKHFRKTPAHAREEMVNPKPASDAMELGTALHAAILEPDKFASGWVVAPKCDRRTNVGKATWADFEANNPGKEHLTMQESEFIKGMQQSANSHPIVSEILSSKGFNEVAIVWTDPTTGLRCKGLLDRLTTYAGWTVIVDLKSCRSALQWDFEKQVASLGYHIQSAAYLEGLNRLASMERRFLFVAIENVSPFCCAVYELDDDSMATGRVLFREYLNNYAKCIKENRWPGYPQSIMHIQIPKWEMVSEELP